MLNNEILTDILSIKKGGDNIAILSHNDGDIQDALFINGVEYNGRNLNKSNNIIDFYFKTIGVKLTNGEYIDVIDNNNSYMLEFNAFNYLSELVHYCDNNHILLITTYQYDNGDADVSVYANGVKIASLFN